jgi:drug/metabolite transporter (DMT)-like permease
LQEHTHAKAWTALFAVYFFWGTTYLGIRIALETFPPLTMISVRFLVSGAILLVAARLFGATLPRGRELWMTALYGIVILGGGNGALTFAELLIPSGLAAVFITTSPFWMVGIERLLPHGERIHASTIIGIAVGFSGVLTLIAPAAFGSGGQSGLLAGFMILQFGCLAWTTGSLLQRRYPTKAHPVVSGAIQQAATGLFYAVPALLMEERPATLHVKGVLALLYLVLFGSIVGYSAYVYALEKLPVAIVSTYTYVNPVVAVFLGWLFYREPFGIREAVAMGLIFLGVAVVNYGARRV